MSFILPRIKKKSEVREEIGSIIKELNSNRSDFTLDESHKIRITSYWLVGKKKIKR